MFIRVCCICDREIGEDEKAIGDPVSKGIPNIISGYCKDCMKAEMKEVRLYFEGENNENSDR